MAAATELAKPQKRRGKPRASKKKASAVKTPAQAPAVEAEALVEITETDAPQEALSEIQQALTAEDRKPIGFQVWWDLACASGLFTDLQPKLDKAGLGWTMNGPAPTGRRFGQALINVRRRLGVDFKMAGRQAGWTIHRPVKYTKSVTQDSQYNLTVDPSVLSSIAVNTKTGAVELSDPDCQIGQAVIAEYQALDGMFIAYQVRNMIQAVTETELRAIKIRRSGGLYFIPSNGPEVLEDLETIQEIVRGIGDCDFYIETLYAGTDGARAASRGTARTLDGKYKEILSTVGSFVEQLEAGDIVSASALSLKTQAARALRREAESYAELLGDRGKELTEAAGAIAEIMHDIADASVEIRALSRARNSERVAAVVQELTADVAAKARQRLAEARGDSTTDDDGEADE